VSAFDIRFDGFRDGHGRGPHSGKPESADAAAGCDAESAIEALSMRVRVLEQEGVELLHQLRDQAVGRRPSHRMAAGFERVAAAEVSALRAEVQRLSAELEREQRRSAALERQLAAGQSGRQARVRRPRQRPAEGLA
jgi:cytochrome c553